MIDRVVIDGTTQIGVPVSAGIGLFAALLIMMLGVIILCMEPRKKTDGPGFHNVFLIVTFLLFLIAMFGEFQIMMSTAYTPK